jgi:hypothetical protein
MGKWNIGNGTESPKGHLLEVKIRNCNPRLNFKDEVVSGRFGDDGFYLSDGGELSFNWDIFQWRDIEP